MDSDFRRRPHNQRNVEQAARGGDANDADNGSPLNPGNTNMNSSCPSQPDARKDFEALCSCATRILAETQGAAPLPWEQGMAVIAFRKLVLTSTSILRLVPGSQSSSTACTPLGPDLGSIGVLSRTLVETVLTMRYLLESPRPERERALHRQVWEYHEYLERRKIMQSVNSRSPTLGILRQMCDQRRVDLERNQAFQDLPREGRKQVLRGEKAKLLTNEDICERAGISRNFYAAMFKYGSNHTHSSPYSFTLMNSKPSSSGICSDVIRLTLLIVAGFLSVGIRDYVSAFVSQFQRIPDKEKEVIALWLGVVKWDLNPFFARLCE
ncbi:MAG: hypothetical protein HYY24_20045 [Verrucomicrobia bacterium]|nr:hypothetical protein [Verrucomicrobiota bacterium]